MKKSVNFVTLAIFAPVLVLAGVAGFLVPAQDSLTSGVQCVPWLLWESGRLFLDAKDSLVSFNFGFGLIDLYQALASYESAAQTIFSDSVRYFAHPDWVGARIYWWLRNTAWGGDEYECGSTRAGRRPEFDLRH
jgi:hypothetical protein